VVVLAALALAGCRGEPPTRPPVYLAPPESGNILHNLVLAFSLRDLHEIDSMLASDFPGRAAFLDSLRCVFEGDPARGIPRPTRVNLWIEIVSHGPDPGAGHEGWLKYVVNTSLTLDFAHDNQLKVLSPAWMYFKREPPGSGVWKLAEWVPRPGDGPAAPYFFFPNSRFHFSSADSAGPVSLAGRWENRK
jgi:hypothetical protein